MTDDAAVRRLATEARAFDEGALVAFANRGLVRRAHRLIDGALPAVAPVPDGSVVVTGDGWVVTYPPDTSITRGRCDCATAGVCAHLVAVVITLSAATTSRAAEAPALPTVTTDPSGDDVTDPGATNLDESPPPDVAAAGEPPTNRDEPRGTAIATFLLALAESTLRRWAGTPDLRWAVDRLASIDPDEIEIDESSHLLVRLPTPLPAVRFMGAALDSTVVEPSGRHDRRVATLAVLVLRQRAGQPAPSLPAPKVATTLPDERRAVAQHAHALAEDALRQGLMHLAGAFVPSLDGLAAGARGARLYRLAGVAEHAADQIDAIDRRDTTADTAALLSSLAELDTLAAVVVDRLDRDEALSEAITGTARSRYEPIGTIELVGCGHYGWGDALFGGTTAVLCEAGGPRLFTVTRPLTIRGRKQEAAIGWLHAGAITALAATRFRLTDARASADHRLSTSPSTELVPTGELAVADLDAACWMGEIPSPPSRLLGRTGRRWIVGRLDHADPAASFDPIAQHLTWAVTIAGQPLTVALGYRRHTERAIEALAAFVPDGPTHLVGLLDASTGALTVQPVAVVVDATLRVLDDQQIRSEPRTDSAPAVVATAPRQLDRLEAEIVRVAERGSARADPAAVIALSRRAGDRGLTTLGTVLADDARPLERRLLRAAWVLAEHHALAAGDDLVSGDER